MLEKISGSVDIIGTFWGIVLVALAAVWMWFSVLGFFVLFITFLHIIIRSDENDED